MISVRWLGIICILLNLFGCVDSKKDMENYVEQVKKTSKVQIEPIPAPKTTEHVVYTAENLRSPFVLSGGKYVSTQAVGPHGEVIKQQPRPDLDRPREYLEQFPLTALSMVGTLSKPHMNWGLVKDLNGMIHAVKVGDYMGLNSGQIIAITPDQIKLNETVPNGSGGWMEARSTLDLVQSVASETQLETQTETKPGTQPGTQTKTSTQQPAAAQRPGITQPAVGGIKPAGVDKGGR